eukprot:TRINITY_DN17286_c0_g3_i1.p1 TRINITY_DN17286_c0_g3~~TRINITY_DN17286_c0_g3_i1.p1  ORF type:complete len:169 (+),score=31.78 TRINITY_DN17286_c0_g3_i1:62-568(+)
MAAAVIEKRLAQLGVRIPVAPAAAGNYLPYRRSGTTVYIAGQLPKAEDGTMAKGRLGDSCDIKAGQEAARLCAINIVSQMKAACNGDLDKVTGILKVEGFVSCTPDFAEHPQVINGCSDFLVEVFGREIGAHARFAVGCSSLPLGVPVEIGATVEIADDEDEEPKATD